MGAFVNFIKSFIKGNFYVIDKETLRTFLEEENSFANDNALELATDINIYINSEKLHVQIIEEVLYCNGEKFHSIGDFINIKLDKNTQYFKVEPIGSNSVVFEQYKEQHPELKVEDY